jgi:enamine deaminase RidA (YjgF/YER057c/UK114 family)
VPLPTHQNPKGVAPPDGAYSHVAHVRVGSDLYFISGQVGFTPDGRLPTGFEEQVSQATMNVLRALEDLGMGPENLVKLTNFVVDGNPDGVVYAARTSVFGATTKAASTLVYVPRLGDPRFLFEIEAIASR